jgi:hypothetical protein
MRKLALLLVLCLATFTCADIPVGLKECSVMIEASGGYGSGVVFKNREHSFCWSAAHVVSGTQEIKTVIDVKTGRPKVVATYSDVYVVTDIKQEGRLVGKNARLAKIIRYSEDEDIALLYVYEKNYGEASTVFFAGVPNDGADAWHVGSFRGPRGLNSISKGVVAATGRLRRNGHNETDNPFICDQYSGQAFHGSSGGAIFLNSGECLGLVTEYLAGDPLSQGSLVFTPSRRLISFAEQNRVEYATNDKVAVPPLPKMFSQQVTVGDLEIPKDWPKGTE